MEQLEAEIVKAAAAMLTPAQRADVELRVEQLLSRHRVNGLDRERIRTQYRDRETLAALELPRLSLLYA